MFDPEDSVSMNVKAEARQSLRSILALPRPVGLKEQFDPQLTLLRIQQNAIISILRQPAIETEWNCRDIVQTIKLILVCPVS